MSGSRGSGAEDAYLRLAGFSLAKPYVEGRSVAYLEGGDPGYGARTLSQAAESVTLLSEFGVSGETAASSGMRRQKVVLPDLPYPDDYFGAVVAFGVLEKQRDPEALIREMRRVLEPEGSLVLCTPDKQAHANELNLRDPASRRELYVPELEELLQRHFPQARLYRIAAVAGGLIFRPGGDLSTAPEGSAEAPASRFVAAVCAPETPEQKPRLVLDPEDSVFREADLAREEAALLRREIEEMQSTEVQAFRDALGLERGRVAQIRSSLEERSKALEDREERLKEVWAGKETLEARNKRLQGRLQQIESSRAWRLLGLYRRLRGALKPRGAGKG
jgi:SAM-dependent methyltransferase